MVISAAVGGRGSLVGAVYGTLLVNFGKTFFSESFPELWLFLIGALFIAGRDGVPERRWPAATATCRQAARRRWRAELAGTATTADGRGSAHREPASAP